jgi:DUF1680 family protein
MTLKKLLLAVGFLIGSPLLAQQHKTLTGNYPIQPVLFTDVKLTDNFWAPRIKINHDVTIPFTLAKCKETGRIKNFEIAAGEATGKFCTDFTFDDSDLYKIIEGASYAMQISKDPVLEAKVDSIIALIGRAQESDGYIYTNRTIMGDKAHEWAGAKRWEKEADLSHELYNIGHLIEAAIAHTHATGKKDFLAIAIKAADRVCEDFGPDKLHIYSGHQIIELALAKLYVETGNKKYLDMGKFFLDIREGGEEYNQAHKKVIDQHEAVGHAVRATYMYAGMADIAALTQDPSYITAIDNIWEDVVKGKIYLTGGIGSTGNWEGFGAPYHLPNVSAYNETCASIANVYWNYRLFLLHGDSKYFDVLERTLYNSFLSGVGLTGDLFFYPNPLESHGQHARSPWFSCACCPGNVARFVPSVGGYFYGQKDKSIFVNLFAAGTAQFKIPGNSVTLEQKTNYPWDGNIDLLVSPQRTGEFEIKVRVPGWAVNKPIPSDLYTFNDLPKDQPKILVNNSPITLKLDKGYVSIKRKWKKGDVISLQLPMAIRKVAANPQVKDDQGKLAVERGPLVYCVEWPDVKDKKVLNLMIPENSSLAGKFQPELFNGVYVIEGSGKSVARTSPTEITTSDTQVRLIPYYAWAHRGPGEMMVWIPAIAGTTRPLPMPTIASQSMISASKKTRGLMALNDQMEPQNSNDHSITYYHWWPKKDTVQWVQYDFKETSTITSSKVYWYDDGPDGGCRIPLSWRLLYKQGNEWIPVKATYAVKKDAYSNVKFDPIKTNALRMEVTLPKEFSAGIMEWSVD